MTDIAESTKKLNNVRKIGAIVAADLVTQNNVERVGFEIYKRAVKLGALLRPLGNTIYWLPPLTVSYRTLKKLQEITYLAINI